MQIMLNWSCQLCTMPVCVLLLSLSLQKLSCSLCDPQREVNPRCNDRAIDGDKQQSIPCIQFHVSLKDCLTLLLPAFFLAALQMAGDEPLASNSPVFWRTVLKSMGNTTLNSCILHFLCLQWAIWLATCQLKIIEEFQVQS